MSGEPPLPEPTRPTLVGDVVDRSRRTGAAALHAVGADRTLSYRDLCTLAHRAGNLLEQLGVRRPTPASAPDGSRGRVEIAPDPLPAVVTTWLGGALVGAVTDFDPRCDGRARLTLVRAADADHCDPPPGSKLVVHGDAPSRHRAVHWEGAVWSENPAVRPVAVAPDDGVVSRDGRRYSHAEVVAAAAETREAVGIGPADRVVVRTSLADPRVLAAGVVAPLAAGGTVVLGAPAGSEHGDVTVGTGPEPRVVDSTDVDL